MKAPNPYTTSLLFKAEGTADSVLAGVKDVTRRLAATDADGPHRYAAGKLSRAMRRDQRAGGKPFAELRLKRVERIPLAPISQEEVRREGFPAMSPREFLAMFRKLNGLGPRANPDVWRIEFRVEKVLEVVR